MLDPKESIKNMSGYSVPMFEDDWNIKIDSNENNYGPSPKVFEALSKCNIKNISFYPFYGELTEKIAEYYSIEAKNVKVTNGADEAIQSIIQTYLDNGQALLTVVPSFDMPIIYTHIQNGKVIKVPFVEKWKFPIEDFLSKLEEDSDKIKVIYLASPNNPTGNLISEEDLKKILDKSDNKVVLIDETYANYSETTFKNYINTYDNVFIVRSFSKDFALAGMRLGCIISNEANIVNLKKVVSPFSVNAYAVVAGMAALNDISYFNKVRKEIFDTKKELASFLSDLGGIVYNSYANFLLVDFKSKAEFVYKKLKKQNILVKLFKNGSILENFIRITIPTKEGFQNIKQALEIKPSLVFDMDGVLIDASNSYRIAIEKTFEKHSGMKISQKEIQEAKNLGGLNNDWDLTEFLLNKYGFNVGYSDIVDTFQSIYWDDKKGLINNEKPLFKKEIFEKLSERFNLAIFTGRPKEEALFALEKFKVEEIFFPIITSSDIPQDKGKPDSFGLNLVKDLMISNEFYYFGDTKDDMICAYNAGYKPIGVLPPKDKSQELIQNLLDNNANSVLKSINDIETIF